MSEDRKKILDRAAEIAAATGVGTRAAERQAKREAEGRATPRVDKVLADKGAALPAKGGDPAGKGRPDVFQQGNLAPGESLAPGKNPPATPPTTSVKTTPDPALPPAAMSAGKKIAGMVGGALGKTIAGGLAYGSENPAIDPKTGKSKVTGDYIPGTAPAPDRLEQSRTDAIKAETKRTRRSADRLAEQNKQGAADIDISGKAAAGEKIDYREFGSAENRQSLTGDRISESSPFAGQIKYDGFLAEQGVTPEQMALARGRDTLAGRPIDPEAPEYGDLLAGAEAGETEAGNILDRQQAARQAADVTDGMSEEEAQKAILDRILAGGGEGRRPSGRAEAAEQLKQMDELHQKEVAAAKAAGRPEPTSWRDDNPDYDEESGLTPFQWEKNKVKKAERQERARQRAIDTAAARRNGTTPEVEATRRTVADQIRGRALSPEEQEMQDQLAQQNFENVQSSLNAQLKNLDIISRNLSSARENGGDVSAFETQLKDAQAVVDDLQIEAALARVGDPVLRRQIRSAYQSGGQDVDPALLDAIDGLDLPSALLEPFKRATANLLR